MIGIPNNIPITKDSVPDDIHTVMVVYPNKLMRLVVDIFETHTHKDYVQFNYDSEKYVFSWDDIEEGDFALYSIELLTHTETFMREGS